MTKNLEIKVELKNLDEVAHDIETMGLREVGSLYQIDKYYLVGKKKLKLRNVNNNELHLIYYSRPDVERSRVSHYYIFRFRAQSQRLIEKTLGLFFTLKTIIVKKRILYLYRHTRIHLDDVENIGKFLELETIFDKNLPLSNFYKEHNTIVNALRLSRYRKIRSSYSDLI